jgi:hypothetical protein
MHQLSHVKNKVMKKFISFLSLFLLIFGLGTTLSAQVDSTGIVIPPVGEGFGFGSLVAISGITIFLTALLNKIFKVVAPLWKQVISWVISIAIVGAANLLNIGFAADFTLVTTFLYGLANGLLSNGVFDLSFIRLLLSFFKLTDQPIAIVEPATANIIEVAKSTPIEKKSNPRISGDGRVKGNFET